MICYRLYVGHNDGETGEPIPALTVREAIVDALIEHHIPGFTLTSGTGHWARTTETCTVVDIVGVPSMDYNVQKAGEQIRHMLNQQEVLLTCAEIEATHIKA